MKTQISFLTLLILIFHQSYSQCDYKTVNRPDGITINYFNPKPVILNSDYEVGTSIYKNSNTNEFTLNITLRFKKIAPEKLDKSLVIQTESSEGIELPIVVSELMNMNGSKVAIGNYYLDERSISILRNYDLKTIYFYLEGNLIGSSVDRSNDLLKLQLDCFK